MVSLALGSARGVSVWWWWLVVGGWVVGGLVFALPDLATALARRSAVWASLADQSGRFGFSARAGACVCLCRRCGPASLLNSIYILVDRTNVFLQLKYLTPKLN